jgi:RNA-directed DNA polymerase
MQSGDTDKHGETHATAATGGRRNLPEVAEGVSRPSTREKNCCPRNGCTMEAVVERENMMAAMRRVEANKGSAGVDDKPVESLRPYLKEHWPRIKEALLSGRYKPNVVRRVNIPKPDGKGVRQLGIPTVIDRLIQQALHQVMQPVFDGNFSESSYGFRPGRSAQQAVLAARKHVASGRRWVVDMDMEKFFDRVNHDVLMARVARTIEDKRILGLIRRYLQAGVMEDGLVSQRIEGTPQGGPLSPLLSNILLDELDKELEKRGHVFCRYADDCNIYVQSRRAGERVMRSVSQFLAKRLKLRVNPEKSAVDRPWNRKFLGYSMTFDKQPRLKVASGSVKRFKNKFKDLFRAGRGRNLAKFIAELQPVLIGWSNYFRLSQVKSTFEELDGWIRRKLRCILWRQWKRTYTRFKNLLRQGLDKVCAWKSATNGRGAWWNSGASHMNACYPKSFFDKQGLVSLLNRRNSFATT